MRNLFKDRSGEDYIVIGGCGRLGAGLAARLSLDKKDVVVIDRKEDAFRKLAASFGGQTMCSDLNNISRLEDAGMRQADVFLAVTDRDNVNIMAAQIAKQVYGVRHVLARIYDAEKLKLLDGTGIAYFCPTELSEKEINRFMNWEDSDED